MTEKDKQPATDVINVLVMGASQSVDLSAIEKVAPGRINVEMIPPGAFAPPTEMHPAPGGLFRHPTFETDLSDSELADELRKAHVLLVGLPYPRFLADRMPQLRWAHFRYAGISDFKHCDLWGTGVSLTSSRGQVEILPIAETVLGMVFVFSRNLNIAVTQTRSGEISTRGYDMKLVQGKTLGVVGIGGIGGQVARLGKAVGMRVLGMRRTASGKSAAEQGVDGLYPQSALAEMLAECDFVVLSAPLTAQTEGLFNASVIGQMKPGAVLLNVARGALIDESALKRALESGHLGGAYLDVYTNEAFGPPDPDLLAMPNVIMTPHNSGKSDRTHDFSRELFTENLGRFVAGEPLSNVMDPASGY